VPKIIVIDEVLTELLQK